MDSYKNVLVNNLGSTIQLGIKEEDKFDIAIDENTMEYKNGKLSAKIVQHITNINQLAPSQHFKQIGSIPYTFVELYEKPSFESNIPEEQQGIISELTLKIIDNGVTNDTSIRWRKGFIKFYSKDVDIIDATVSQFVLEDSNDALNELDTPLPPMINTSLRLKVRGDDEVNGQNTTTKINYAIKSIITGLESTVDICTILKLRVMQKGLKI